MTRLAARLCSRPSTLVVLIALAASEVALGGGCTRVAAASPSPRDRLVFSDNFKGQALDASKWITCYPWARRSGCTNASNAEREWYLPGNVTVSSGALQLTARRQDVVAGGHQYAFTSGMVASAKAFRFTYGYVEFRARLPQGAGLWSALWLLPANQSWPPEIDVVEMHGNDPSVAVLTYHPRGGRPVQRYVRTADLSMGWHDFALDWRPGSITWLVDGQTSFRFEGHVPNQPMYLVMDLAVSRSPAPNSTTPASASLDVDMVRVWQPG